MSRTTRSWPPLSASCEAAAAVADDGGDVAVGAQALGDEGGDALLVLDDQDACHQRAATGTGGWRRRRTAGRASAAERRRPERAPAPPPRSGHPRCSRRRATRRRRGRGRSRATIDRPEPEPVGVLVGAAAEPLEDAVAVGLGDTAGRCRAPTTARGRRRRPSRAATSSPGLVCRTALWASCSSAWVMRCWSAVTRHLGDLVDRPRALAEAGGLGGDGPGELGGVDRARARGTRVARSWRAGSGRRPGAPSGRPRRAAARGSRRPRRRRSASISSRWPCRIVSGVRSSWPASSSSCRWPTNAASSRSSMPLKVRVSAVMSSLPVERQPARQVGLGDLVGGLAHRAQRSAAAGRPG